jgi:hypothetical protein
MIRQEDNKNIYRRETNYGDMYSTELVQNRLGPTLNQFCSETGFGNHGEFQIQLEGDRTVC